MSETKLFEDVYDLANTMIKDGEKPFAVAAVFVLAGLQMYKTSLSDEDYEKMVGSIYDSRDRVRRLEEIATIRTLN